MNINQPNTSSFQDPTQMIAQDNVIMLFDGLCGFCGGSVNFILERSWNSPLLFCAMQSTTGKALMAALDLSLEDDETMVLIDRGEVLTKARAVLRLGHYMQRPWPLVARLFGRLPTAPLDRLYDQVARNRYRILGQRSLCPLPSPAKRARFLV